MQHATDQSPKSPFLATRRQTLQAIAAGAVAATAGRVMGAVPAADAPAASAATGATPRSEGTIARAAAAAVLPVALADVRLLEGPFLAAQERDEKYLLSLEPDRLLHNFRTNAGLEPKASVYAGWESARTWTGLRCQGHTLGHYLTACAMMHASTGKDDFKRRCDYIVSELKLCQEAGKTGLVSAFPDGDAQFANIAAGRRFVGVIWYTMHKIFAGLHDAHVYARSPGALEVLTKLADYAITVTRNLSDAQFQRMLGVEHGGMNEVLADIYVLTGEKKYLELAQRFCHRAVMEPAAQGQDRLDGLHSNTQIPKFIGFERLHELTGQGDYHAAAAFFWETVTNRRSFVTGGNGDNEHFFRISDFPRHLGPKTMETCCSHNMLKLTRRLFMQDPSSRYADYYENALYNAILASQDPDSGMFTYFQPLKPGYLKIFCTPIDSFWCCTGTGMENHAKYGDSIYFSGKDALYVNLFIASELNWRQRGVTLTQTTRYPDESRTRLTIKAGMGEFALKIRHPQWCAAATITVTSAGKVDQELTSRTPGTYAELRRTWKPGDVVDIELPMALRTVHLPGAADTVAIVYGPIVLAGTLGREGITPGSDLIVNERTIGSVLNQRIDVPALSGDAKQVVAAMKPVAGQSLTFTAPVEGPMQTVTFVPFFRVAHERYSVYWKLAPKV